MPGLSWECPKCSGKCALGSPIFCPKEPQFSNIFNFLFKSLISTPTPLLFLISFFPMALNHGGLSPGCHIWEFSCPGGGGTSRIQGKFSCGSKGLVTPSRGVRSPQE